MKTAVLISGQLRTFEKCYPTQRWHVYSHYADIKFFVSCDDDERASSAYVLKEDYKGSVIERVSDPSDKILGEVSQSYGEFAPYKNSVPHKELLIQMWRQKRCFDFASENGLSECDTIIRMRADNYFHRFVPDTRPEFNIGGDKVAMAYLAPQTNECFAPWWGRFGGMNDRFAVMGREAALYYFNVFDFYHGLLKKGCPFHPETLLAATLQKAGLKTDLFLDAEFSSERLNGTRRWPEITVSDMVHYMKDKK